MISQVEIENFRGFPKLEMTDMGRITLVSGKHIA